MYNFYTIIYDLALAFYRFTLILALSPISLYIFFNSASVLIVPFFSAHPVFSRKTFEQIPW